LRGRHHAQITYNIIFLYSLSKPKYMTHIYFLLDPKDSKPGYYFLRKYINNPTQGEKPI